MTVYTIAFSILASFLATHFYVDYRLNVCRKAWLNLLEKEFEKAVIDDMDEVSATFLAQLIVLEKNRESYL